MHQHTRRRVLVQHASNAALLESLTEALVAVAAARGLETAEVVVTPSLVTRGPRVFRHAKHDRSTM